MTSTTRPNQMLVYLKTGVRYRTILGQDVVNDIECSPPVEVDEDGWYQVTAIADRGTPSVWKVK